MVYGRRPRGVIWKGRPLALRGRRSDAGGFGQPPISKKLSGRPHSERSAEPNAREILVGVVSRRTYSAQASGDHPLRGRGCQRSSTLPLAGAGSAGGCATERRQGTCNRGAVLWEDAASAGDRRGRPRDRPGRRRAACSDAALARHHHTSRKAGCWARVASISPSSMRKARIFTWKWPARGTRFDGRGGRARPSTVRSLEERRGIRPATGRRNKRSAVSSDRFQVRTSPNLPRRDVELSAPPIGEGAPSGVEVDSGCGVVWVGPTMGKIAAPAAAQAVDATAASVGPVEGCEPHLPRRAKKKKKRFDEARAAAPRRGRRSAGSERPARDPPIRKAWLAASGGRSAGCLMRGPRMRSWSSRIECRLAGDDQGGQRDISGQRTPTPRRRSGTASSWAPAIQGAEPVRRHPTRRRFCTPRCAFIATWAAGWSRGVDDVG